MTKSLHLSKLSEGTESWNQWRRDNPGIRPDLSGIDISYQVIGNANFMNADLKGANLKGADLTNASFKEANLEGAELSEANLWKANLVGAILANATISNAKLDDASFSGCNLRKTNFVGARAIDSDFSYADLRSANFNNSTLTSSGFEKTNLSHATIQHAVMMETNLMEADLSYANLSETILCDANLFGANLHKSILVKTDFQGAEFTTSDLSEANLEGAILQESKLIEVNLQGTNLNGCKVYGSSVWGIQVDETTSQYDLVITPLTDEIKNEVTVDDLEVAQFIYLLLDNKRVRRIIDTITSKVVLILGRFTENRKPVLNTLREELRKRDFTPVLFDFDKPSNRDLTETISTLAHMSRFIIADITEARSIPQELQKIVPNLPSLPVQPLILEGHEEYGMFDDFGAYLSVLAPYRYKSEEHLISSLEDKVIKPALEKLEEIEERRRAFEHEFIRK